MQSDYHNFSDASSSAEGASAMNSELFNNLNLHSKQTKDGQPAKRRGPKPDSKPALTRRQELNRQAQRTHRERKELYIKALEGEVMKLREDYANSIRDQERLQQENQRLRDLLAAHGISYDFDASPIQFTRSGSGYDPSSSGSLSGSYAGTLEGDQRSPAPPSDAIRGSSNASPLDVDMKQSAVPRSMSQLPNTRIDYDQVGIDFVLTYDSQGQPIRHPQPYPSPPPQY